MAKSKSSGKTGDGPLERSPSHLLHRALQLALDLYAAEFGTGGVTQRQYAVLCAASAKAGATQTELVRATGIDRSTLADMVARMIAKGYLARERSTTDARANAVHLTPLGEETLAASQPKMAAVDAKLLKQISGGGRRDTFMTLLRELAHASGAPAKTPKAEKAPKAVKLPKAAKPKAALPDEGRKKKARKAA
jgi:MarR family transcriptional regulator, temperature-dependent positive regulator of motility